MNTINWSKVVEDHFSLLVTGAAILIFYFIKKFFERRSKEKEVWFNMYEQKKLETIVQFVTSYNTILIKLEEGFWNSTKTNLQREKVKEFGKDTLQLFSSFYTTFSALSFFLTAKELEAFHLVYDSTKNYYQDISNTLLMLVGENPSHKPINLTQIREKVSEENAVHIKAIGEYFRTFIK